MGSEGQYYFRQYMISAVLHNSLLSIGRRKTKSFTESVGVDKTVHSGTDPSIVSLVLSHNELKCLGVCRPLRKQGLSTVKVRAEALRVPPPNRKPQLSLRRGGSQEERCVATCSSAAVGASGAKPEPEVAPPPFKEWKGRGKVA